MVDGKTLESGAKELEIMLGEGLARNLNAKPGTGLTLMASTTDGAMNALDVTVKGIISTGVPALDKRIVYTDIAKLVPMSADDSMHSQNNGKALFASSN